MERGAGNKRKGFLPAAAFLAALLLATAPVPAHSKPPSPSDGVETIHSEGFRELETVVSRGGWHLMGRDPEGYRIGTGTTDGMKGPLATALQACNAAALRGPGALEHTIAAGDYAGKRVRVTGRAKLQVGYSNFYMNVIGRDGHAVKQVSMMNSRGDWKTSALVTDIDADAIAIDIGVTLWGTDHGVVWLDPVRIEIVGREVPTAGSTASGGYERRLNDPVVSCDGVRDGVRG